MMDVGTQVSLDDPPCALMFAGVKQRRTQSQTTALTHAFTEMALSIASALQPPTTPTNVSRHISGN